jgi:hypothetical protein
MTLVAGEELSEVAITLRCHYQLTLFSNHCALYARAKIYMHPSLSGDGSRQRLVRREKPGRCQGRVSFELCRGHCGTTPASSSASTSPARGPYPAASPGSSAATSPGSSAATTAHRPQTSTLPSSPATSCPASFVLGRGQQRSVVRGSSRTRARLEAGRGN